MAERFKDSPSNNEVIFKGGSVSLLYILRSNASSKVNIWRLYIKNQREKLFQLYKLLICEGKKKVIKRKTKAAARLDFLKRRMYKSREIMIDTTQELVVSQTKCFNRNLLKTVSPPSHPKRKRSERNKKLVFQDEKKYNKELHFLLK